MNRKEFIKMASGAAAFAVAGCATEEAAKTADHLILIPRTLPLLQPSLSVIPLQLLSYYVSLEEGCSIDKPRNLAKSVTVE